MERPSAEADGVLLSDDGVPVVVARKSLAASSAIVACKVTDASGALVAAKEGADLIVAPSEDVVAAVAGKISVPTFAPPRDGWSGVVGWAGVKPLAEAGALGVAMETPPPSADAAEGVPTALEGLKKALAAAGDAAGNQVADATAAVLAAKAAANAAKTGDDEAGVGSTSRASSGGLAGKLIDAKAQALLERERRLLDDAVVFLTESVSALEENNLLVEARRGLEELFLLVIVGEFNAGKSSVINAVLGKKHLREGILPTTNEITVLRYGDKAATEQSKDGFYTQLVPAELLKEVNIVDTPGTNVILERQQRLTEEFVPRADLVLFVLSADRPMTESEVTFLKYIRKWDKKVVFVVNKCDTISENDVTEVKGFVEDNAKRLLGVTDPTVLPVSARRALKAKQESASLTPSGFDALEEYVLSFLGGGGGGGGGNGNAATASGEGLRLKLGTPIQVGTMLFTAAEDVLAEERADAAAEVAAATGVADAMAAYVEAMASDFSSQKQAVRDSVSKATARCDELLDQTLRLTNASDLFATYVLGDGGGGKIRERYESQVLAGAEEDLRAALREHTGWLRRNNERQVSAYDEAVRARGFDVPEFVDDVADDGIGDVVGDVVKGVAENKDDDDDDDDAKDATAETTKTVVADALAGEDPTKKRATSGKIFTPAEPGTPTLAIAAGFDHDAAAAALENEVKDAVYSTVGAAGGAFVVAVFLSGFLDNLAEDVLAFALTAAVGYVSVLSLPLKRAEAKAKVRDAADALLADVEAAMEAEFQARSVHWFPYDRVGVVNADP